MPVDRDTSETEAVAWRVQTQEARRRFSVAAGEDMMKQAAFALALATALLATPSLPRAQAEDADASRNDYQ